uniref:Putative WRKY transcription factor 69 isoform X1 n=1 Tax=Rhizophora mucronata TaxID=61149 RepID=A0A2P2LN53_RHIMU
MGTIEKVAVDDSPALRLDSKVSEPKSQPKRRCHSCPVLNFLLLFNLLLSFVRFLF